MQIDEGIDQLIRDASKPSSAQSAAPPPTSRFEIPMREDKALEGLISYLTTKHSGDVHEKGIVTITSTSVWKDGPVYARRNVADLFFHSRFDSKDEPGQWVCWDFHEFRVRPTHYTINSYKLKSLVVEGSPDGASWTEIDRQTDNLDFQGGHRKADNFRRLRRAPLLFRSHWKAVS
jgi:hypothetical protein